MLESLVNDVRSLLGITLTAGQVSAFETYASELLDWNEKFNLTAIRDLDGIRTKHFLDSLTCLLVMGKKTTGRLVDIGTGAGFPGIPLKIVLPALQVTLVESIEKKAGFCRHIVETLKLANVQVLTARAEELGQDKAHRQQYDWAVARAVAAMPVLAEYLLPLARVGGSMIAQKGESGPAEAISAEKAFGMLGGRLKEVRKINLPGVTDDRYLVAVEKIMVTPSGYPRRVGLAAKRPIGIGS